jgi:hypothetical protein
VGNLDAEKVKVVLLDAVLEGKMQLVDDVEGLGKFVRFDPGRIECIAAAEVM